MGLVFGLKVVLKDRDAQDHNQKENKSFGLFKFRHPPTENCSLYIHLNKDWVRWMKISAFGRLKN